MSPQFLEIEEKALELSPEDKQSLVDSLLESLSPSQDDHIRREWIAVAQQRSRELLANRELAIPFDEALTNWKRALG